jgi:putative membrane protein
LVLASVFYVGKRISKLSPAVIISFIIGAAIAVYISFLGIGQENNNFFYLLLCGVAAMCSMILPGLSGSFILLIMGNYKLVAIDAINDKDLGILLPVMIGAVGGLIAFSHILSWVFKKFRDETISTLTGFILGSLSILWPWQNPVYMDLGNGEQKITHYSRYLPEQPDMHFWMAIICILLGIFSIWAIEKMAKHKA